MAAATGEGVSVARGLHSVNASIGGHGCPLTQQAQLPLR